MPVVLTLQERDADRFRLMLTGEVSVVTSAQDLNTYLDAHQFEDLVIFGSSISMPVAADIAERYRLSRPTLGTVLLRERVDALVLNDAMRAGIREVVSASDVEALGAACRRSLALSQQLRGQSQSPDGPSHGKLIMVYGPKGGTGMTTVAVNIAAALADLDIGRVCLVDFELEFGDVAIFLQLKPEVTISSGLQMKGQLDRRSVEALVTPYRPRFDTLLAPVKPADAEFVTPEYALDLLANLRQIYDYVVIDASTSFGEITLRTFDIADSYQLVTTLDLPAIKDMRVALETMDALGFPRSKWNIVLNRADSQVGLSPADVEEILGVSVSTAIPSSRDVPAVLNAGKTLIEELPKHPVTQAIRSIALREAGQSPEVQVAESKHWWHRGARGKAGHS